MKQLIADVLTPFALFMYNLVMAIPLGAVRVLVFGILAVLAVWVIRMQPQLPENGDEKQYSIVRDLRLFALMILVLQAVLYVIF